MGSRSLLAAAAALSLPALAWATDAKVPYPENFRAMFHVKSMAILDGHPLADPFKGIHHIYANGKALDGYKTGAWPDGAVLVFDLLEYTQDGGALREGPRKLTGVMRRDAARYKETGGWGYEGFAGDSKTKRLVGDMMGQCHGCHAQREKSGFVFSAVRK